MPQLSNGAQLSTFRTAFNNNGTVRNNFLGGRSPVASDNAAAGYEVGSRWIDTAANRKWTLTLLSGSVATWAEDAVIDLRSVTIATGTAGSQAAYNAATNTLTIPRGDTGATGPQGPQGLQGPPGTGEGSADAGAIENSNFGTAVMSQFPSLTPPSQAVMTANRTALINALAWSAATGGVVQLGYGILYIWGEVELPLGASINGKGMDASRIQQGQLPQNATDPWLDVLTAPAVTGATGGNGYNNITNMTIDGGWNLQSFVGAGSNWNYAPARMTAAGLRIATPIAGTGGASAFREAGSDAHVRVQNVLFQNIAGYGYHMTGRGENFMINIEIRRANRGFYLAAPDCFATLHTIYTIADIGAELRSGAGNLRWTNSKLWFIGMGSGSEQIGAGIYIPDAGTQGISMVAVDTQDTWGPGLYIMGDSNLYYQGFIDEAAGGRLEQQSFGWPNTNTRSLPRTFVRVGGTCRRATINAQIRGGARNGTGNYPFLAHLAGSAIEFNRIQFEGPLSGINMASGTITGASYANGIVLANGLTNGSSPRYNEIRHGFRLLHGAMTAADLANAAHPVNDALYGPGSVIMTSNLPAWRRPYGGWYRLDEMFRPITRAAYAALPAEERNDPFYNFAYTD